ncbi:DnaD domain protein [Mammaliicoccus sciuri]|uniref:DnaD domain protein n=1 Tax=Mammaliicoccus sciuri TaxID=1296 RepID=UPI003F57686B
MTEQIKSSITGYGLVFKRVMKDTNIDIEAKALYSYLSAYAGSSESAFPSVELICHELDISKNRFRKYRKQLEDNGYLNIERVKSNNLYGKNLYTLHHEPRPLQNRAVESEALENRAMKNRALENLTTTSNSFTSNNITNNSEKNNSSSKQQSPFDFYQSNGFGVLKPYISEQIGAWIDDFKENGNEIVIEAMKESLNNNVYKWNYVNSILKSWFNDGIKSVEDISARNNKRSKQEEVADEDNPYLKYMNN